MKNPRRLNCIHRSQYFRITALLLLIALAVFGGYTNVCAQKPSIAKLTLAQVKELISHGVPDPTMATQIRERGIAFTPSPAIIESIRTAGAGPQTLSALEAMLPEKPAPRQERMQSGNPGEHTNESLAISSTTAPAPMTLAEAQGKIPTILRVIYHALNAGNPLEVAHFFSSDIANDSRQLDSICHPFAYRSHYIEAIIERPDQTFEARVHALFAPFQEKVQVLVFRPEGNSLVLVQIVDEAAGPWTWSNAVGRWYEPYRDTAIQMARDFIYAAKAQRSDVLAGMAATGMDVSQYTTEPCWHDLFQAVTQVTSINANLVNYDGLKIEVDTSIQTSLGYSHASNAGARFWFDMLQGQAKLVAAEPFYDAYGNMFFQTPASCSNVGKSFFATVEAPNLEAYTLKRFGLQSTSSSVAGTAAGAGDATPSVSQASTSEPPSSATQQRIVASNGNLRISVSECHAQEGKVFCRGEMTYIGQGTQGFQMGGGASMIDDHGGEFQRSDAWFGELNGPHQPVAQLPSGIPVACVWVYDGYTLGSESVNLVFPDNIVLRNVPLMAAGTVAPVRADGTSADTAVVLSSPSASGPSVSSQDFNLSMSRGAAALRTSDWNGALADYIEATQTAPRSGEPWLEIGYIDLIEGKFDDAKQSFYKSTDLGFSVTLPSVEHKAFTNTSGMLSIGHDEVKFTSSSGKEIFRVPVSQVSVKSIGAAAIAGPNSFYFDLFVAGKKHRFELHAMGVMCSFDNGDNLICDGNGIDQQRAVAEWVRDVISKYSAGAPATP